MGWSYWANTLCLSAQTFVGRWINASQLARHWQMDIQVKEQTTPLSACLTFDNWAKITQSLTKCSSFSQMQKSHQSYICKNLTATGNVVYFDKAIPTATCISSAYPYISLTVCVCVPLFDTICMVAEQLCMTDRAWCLLAVSGKLWGKLSPHKDIWLLKAYTAGWSPVTGMWWRWRDKLNKLIWKITKVSYYSKCLL